MRVFAISDLHLPGGMGKSMDRFGPQWEGHWSRIVKDWRERVAPEDWVLIAGDISWAMTLEGAMEDLLAIGALPGNKAMIRGNHDYWWGSIQRLRERLPMGMFALQNDALILPEMTVAGSRGWICPNESVFTAQDEKIYLREVQRMEMSLKAARKMGGERPLLAMIHYPPCNDRMEESAFTDLFKTYAVDHVIYGHLHGPGISKGLVGERGGALYHQTSCDGLDFKLKLILEP